MRLNQNLPPKAVIKKTAHALTTLVLAWIGMSIFAFFAYKYGKEDSDQTWITAAIWIWRLHGIFALLAIWFWIVEKPTEVAYLKEETENED